MSKVLSESFVLKDTVCGDKSLVPFIGLGLRILKSSPSDSNVQT